MSQTISIGVVGPSHWSYMSAVMAGRLKRAVENRRIDVAGVPKGVHADAKRFFRLVVQEIGGGTPENPTASINAYCLAADAMRASQHTVISGQRLKDRLKQYSMFIDQFQEPRQLSEDEVDLAKELCLLFVRLKRAGEEEAYERRIRLELPRRFQLA